MGLGAFGQVLMFVMSLVAATILGLILLARAAHCFLVIVESTAAGMDEVPWPDEPFLDWLWKPIYLFGLMSFWLLLGWFILYLVNIGLAMALPGIVGVIVGVVWLLFPISLYSSLSAQSLVSLLYWPLLRRLGRRLGYLLVLYILTAPLLAGGIVVAYLAVAGDGWWLPIAALVIPTALFIHARLMGRLGWLLSNRTPVKDRKVRRLRNPFKKLKIEVVDPWQMPNEPVPIPTATETGIEALISDIVAETPAGEMARPAERKPTSVDEEVWGVPQDPYGVMTEAQARTSWQERGGDPPVDEGYAVAPPAATPHGDLPPPPRPPEPILLEERLRLEFKPTEPPLLFWSGVLSFPFYERSLGPWLGLVALVAAELFFVRMMVSLAPG